MKGWNGDRRSYWSFRLKTAASTVSSSSGTVASRLSTANASSVSRLSSFSIEAAMHFDSLGIHEDVNGNNMVLVEARIKSLIILVQEFFSVPSANCNIKRGDVSVVERWLTELGVGCVLSLDDAPTSAVEELELDRDARTWIRALHQIEETISFTRPFFPDRGSVGMPSICVEQGEHVGGRCIMDRYHFTLFIQETILKMLTFVDVLVAWDPNMTLEILTMDHMPLPFNKLTILLDVHEALSSYKIRFPFYRPTSVEVESIEKGMDNLLSTSKSKVGEAIWSTLEKIRTKLLEDGGSSSSLNSQGSSDIHNVTRFVMTYIELLQKKYTLVGEVIKGHVPYTENIEPLESMIVDIMSSLQKKLVNISESFSDEGLKFLFLLNNSYNMHQSTKGIQVLILAQLAVDLTQKIEGYMERYLQVSWAPLLSCLFTRKPLWLGKKQSPLSKFESEFQKTYTTQMEWKVPDPELRRKLRQAIRDRIIPGYTENIEDNKVTRPKISPQELEEMLEELFEG